MRRYLGHLKTTEDSRCNASMSSPSWANIGRSRPNAVNGKWDKSSKIRSKSPSVKPGHHLAEIVPSSLELRPKLAESGPSSLAHVGPNSTKSGPKLARCGPI